MAAIPAIELDQGDAPASIGYAPLGGMTIDAAGRVTYDFDGHIHAAGIDIDAAAAGTPSNDHRIHWLRANGTVAAEILGFESTPAGSDHLGLEAGPDIGGFTAQLGLDTFTGSSFVTAQAYPGPSVTIADNLGRSSFLQLSSSASARVVGGLIAWTGAAYVLDPGNTLGLLSVTRTGVGGSQVQLISAPAVGAGGMFSCQLTPYAVGGPASLGATFSPPDKINVTAWLPSGGGVDISYSFVLIYHP